MPLERIHLDGTVRARTPEETWSVLAPRLAGWGITRVARLTGLDQLGLPAWTAIRPGAQTLTASQGKGATDLLAKVSAVMEAVELWHAELPIEPTRYGPAREAGLPYPLEALPVHTWHEALVDVPLDWATARGVLSGREVLVPLGLVLRRARRPLWQPDVFRATSTGLACGNTREEAVLHALYEVVERDVLVADEAGDRACRVLVDPGSVDDPYAASLVGRVQDAGFALELVLVDNAYGIPVCLAYLWSEDFPVWFAGAGCHTHPDIALTRAVTEAAQSRLTCIAGTRDDLVATEADFGALPPRPPAAVGGLRPWGQLVSGFGTWQGGFGDHVRAVAGRIERVTGHEPLCLGLSGPGDPVAAVKVVCPGTRSRTRRAVPR
ncbi:YcaO-like family protein [Streptomyces sp. NPDC086023]|uniref:YcaO-like family protein n=1 Tax=Streptomyces sp. NPDC086023 TaxID=3365746 RepID=UPI0037D0A661